MHLEDRSSKQSTKLEVEAVQFIFNTFSLGDKFIREPSVTQICALEFMYKSAITLCFQLKKYIYMYVCNIL